MTGFEAVHVDYGATFGERGGHRVVEHYGRPERAHRAVRNGVGVIAVAAGVVAVTGADRIEYVDNVLSNRVPTADGEGCYAFLLDPQGRIELDLFVYNAGEQLLIVTPPGHATALANEWAEKVFIQDVSIEAVMNEYSIFGVHGPAATERVATVLTGAGAPEKRYGFVRGEIAGSGVTVVRTGAIAGEESYDVVCSVDDAENVFETLLHQGGAATPFGYETFETLTLEAGSPLFATELSGRLPNVAGQRAGVDYEKGCFVGQEVVARVENRGRPSARLVGLALGDDDDSTEAVPADGASVLADGEPVGEITRAGVSPLLDRVVALATVEYTLDSSVLAVEVDGEEIFAERADLPFVEGSARSDRLPTYPD